MKDFCEICGKLAKCSFISSGCAPVSYNACGKCKKLRAESIDVVCTWLYLEGGPDVAPDYKLKLTSFLNETYVGWLEISIYFDVHKEELEEFFTNTTPRDIT
jgi:hypothetical protein